MGPAVHAPPREQAVELPDNLAEDVQESLQIDIVLEDILAPVAARGDVVQGVGKFDGNRVLIALVARQGTTMPSHNAQNAH
jgi:hypothetical protein